MMSFKNFLNHLLMDIKLDWKNQWQVVIIYLSCKCHKIYPNQDELYAKTLFIKER